MPGSVSTGVNLGRLSRVFKSVQYKQQTKHEEGKSFSVVDRKIFVAISELLMYTAFI